MVLCVMARRSARRTLRDRRGAVVAYTAAMLLALVGFAGFAIDLQRVMLVQTRLKTAIDAAALAAARDFDSANRDAMARAVFTANLNPQGGANATNAAFGATVTGPQIEQVGDNRIRVSASATVQNTLFRVLSTTPTTLNETSVASRQATGLELSIVLDQTGSMREVDTTLGITKINAAKNAINAMLDVLYAGQDTQPNFAVALVPFGRTINLGTSTAARDLLNTTSPAMPAGWDIDAWSGCVEARQNGFDLTDAGPQTLEGRFRPYFWQSTWGAVGSVETGQCKPNNAYPAIATPQGDRRYCFGDNDWGAPANLPGPGNSRVRYLGDNPLYRIFAKNLNPAFGPNIVCALNPVLPLTEDRRQVRAAVDAVTAPWNSGGTTIPVGLHGAWLTLSPNWRGAFPGANPILPRDYGTRFLRKAVVLLSDGANNWAGSRFWLERNSQPVDSIRPGENGDELLYNAYGRLTDKRLQIAAVPGDYSSTYNNAYRALSDRTAATCAAMKAAPNNLEIYVVGFEVAATWHRRLLRDCATSPQHYFESPIASDLQASFRTIAGRLANLRLSE